MENISNISNAMFLGIYRGIIMDNNDPNKLRRCKIKAMPMMDKCLDFPWALCRDPRFVDIPEVGAIVWVEFENGDILHPIYSGYICGTDKKTIPTDVTSYNIKVLKFNNHKFIINDSDKTLKYENSSGATLELTASGQWKINGINLTVDK